MYFKRIELFGFKSFPEKTTIQFESGVTAVVGPNGCGKSNIADAIRWVLGEQSARSLRGLSMEDVIFSGSVDREPVNLAEVSLTLSNESKILPIDYEEVTVTRRLYRSGESEYLINKNPVRLKDIHELLMGTGVGVESYAIMEQGKMDMILSSKPEERRVVFEEAAGVTKFKAKKKEALRKLEQTGQNLLRIHDIIEEVRRQISSVERQAKKAEVYKVEFEKLKNLELKAASHEFLIFENDKKSRFENLSALKNEETAALEVVQAAAERCLIERTRFQKAEGSLRQAESDQMQLSGSIRQRQDRILLNRERIGELLERKENLSRQIEAGRLRSEDFQKQLLGLEQEFQSSKDGEGQGLAFLADLETGFAARESALNQALEAEESLEQSLARVSGEKSAAQMRLARLHADLNAAAFRLKKLGHEEKALLEEIRQIEESQPGSQRPTHRLEQKLAELKARLAIYFRSILSGPAPRFEEAEEAHLAGELKNFSQEILKIPGLQAEGTRQKIEAKLGSVLSEIQEALTLEKEARDKESQEQAALGLCEAEEKAFSGKRQEAEALVKTEAEAKQSFLIKLVEARSQQAHLASKREDVERKRGWILGSIDNEKSQSLLFEKDIELAASKKEALELESQTLEREIGEESLRRDELVKSTENLRREAKVAAAALSELEEDKASKQSFLNGAREKMHALELKNAETSYEIDRLKERIFNAYQVDLAPEGISEEPFDLAAAKAEVSTQREKLTRMGPVNLVAIEEYDELKARREFLTQQEQDLVKAKEDLHKAIVKINRTTRELFIDTFTKIQKSFTDYFRLLFGGGTAELVLLDENDVLESGVEIVARPPGKKLQSILLLSGGEKALTAIALLFAIFKVKPSPFCVLDEIDAPLDESNVERFCGTLREFVSGSQFILITHNKRTMNLADALYGITMAETGISRVVSVRLKGAEVLV